MHNPHTYKHGALKSVKAFHQYADNLCIESHYSQPGVNYMNANEKIEFIVNNLQSLLGLSIEVEKDCDSYIFIVRTPTQLDIGKTTLDFDDKHGDIVFGMQTGVFLSGNVLPNMRMIKTAYHKQFTQYK